MFWHRKNNADWMILLQATEMIKNVFKKYIWEGKVYIFREGNKN